MKAEDIAKLKRQLAGTRKWLESTHLKVRSFFEVSVKALVGGMVIGIFITPFVLATLAFLYGAYSLLKKLF